MRRIGKFVAAQILREPCTIVGRRAVIDAVPGVLPGVGMTRRAGKRIEAAIRSRYDLLIGCIGTCRIQLVLLAGDGVDMTIVRELAGIQNSVVVVEGGTGVGIEKISHEVFGQKAV